MGLKVGLLDWKNYFGAKSLAFLILVVSMGYCVKPTISNHWQLLDDGFIIDESLAKFGSTENNSFFGAGRNFYFHGLFHHFIGLISKNTVAYYLANSLLFVLSSLLIFYICYKSTCAKFISALSAFIFIFSGVVPECVFTLYKTEVKFLFFMLLFVFFWNRFVENYFFKNERFSLCQVLFLCGLFLAGFFLGKELFVLVSISWTLSLITLKLRFSTRDVEAKKQLFSLVILVALTVAVFTLNFLLGVKLPHEGAYTKDHVSTYDLNLLKNHLEIFVRRTPDILLLLIMSSVTFFMSIFRKHGDEEQAIVASNCMIYFTGMLLLGFHLFIWKSIQIYYFYPCYGMLILSCGMTFGRLVWNERSKPLHVLCTFGFIALIYYSSSLNWVRFRSFSKWDNVNGKFMKHVSGLPNKSVVYINYPKSHEIVYHFPKYLRIVKGRPDLVIKSVEDFQSENGGQNVFFAFNWSGDDNHSIGGRGLVSHDYSEALFLKQNNQFVLENLVVLDYVSFRPWFMPYDPIILFNSLKKPSLGKELSIGKWIQFKFGWNIWRLKEKDDN